MGSLDSRNDSCAQGSHFIGQDTHYTGLGHIIYVCFYSRSYIACTGQILHVSVTRDATSACAGQILSCYKYSINTLVSFTRKYKYEGKNQKSIDLFIMVAFSKFLTSKLTTLNLPISALHLSMALELAQSLT